MARGFGARETASPFVNTKAGEPARNSLVSRASKVLSASSEAREKVAELLESVWTQIVYADYYKVQDQAMTKEQIRENKLKMVEIIKSLPKEIRDAIEIPKSDIKNLWRGVGSRNISEDEKWRNGRFVYGFTPDKAVAAGFAGAFQMDGATDYKVIGSDDIESVGGLLDVNKLNALVDDFNARSPKSASIRTSDNEDFETLSKDEKEVIAYDIKFKRNGDKFYAG